MHRFWRIQKQTFGASWYQWGADFFSNKSRFSNTAKNYASSALKDALQKNQINKESDREEDKKGEPDKTSAKARDSAPRRKTPDNYWKKSHVVVDEQETNQVIANRTASVYRKETVNVYRVQFSATLLAKRVEGALLSMYALSTDEMQI